MLENSVDKGSDFWYSPNGLNWTGPINPNFQTVFAQDSQTFDVAPNGTIIAVAQANTPSTTGYVEADIFISRSIDNGRNFSRIGKAALYMDLDPQNYGDSVDSIPRVTALGGGRWLVYWVNRPSSTQDDDIFTVVSTCASPPLYFACMLSSCSTS